MNILIRNLLLSVKGSPINVIDIRQVYIIELLYFYYFWYLYISGIFLYLASSFFYYFFIETINISLSIHSPSQMLIFYAGGSTADCCIFIYLILVLCTSHFRLLTSGEIPVLEGRGADLSLFFLVCCEKNALLFSWQPHICPSCRIEGTVLYYKITETVLV